MILIDAFPIMIRIKDHEQDLKKRRLYIIKLAPSQMRGWFVGLVKDHEDRFNRRNRSGQTHHVKRAVRLERAPFRESIEKNFLSRRNKILLPSSHPQALQKGQLRANAKLTGGAKSASTNEEKK